MSYYVGSGRPPLGLSAGATTLVATGANMIIPGSGPIVAVGSSLLSNLFGGNRDAVRLAREQWFEQGARQGSIIANQILIGGTVNTASNERGYYSDGIKRILGDPRTAPFQLEAQRLGAYWDTTDNDSSDKMRALVENELSENAQVATPSNSTVTSSSSSSNTQTLPAMTTKAPFNYWPWVLGAAGVGAAVLIGPRIFAPSRRR